MEKFKMQHLFFIISGTSCIVSVEMPETTDHSYTLNVQVVQAYK